jgi:hypothetical protein
MPGDLGSSVSALLRNRCARRGQRRPASWPRALLRHSARSIFKPVHAAQFVEWLLLADNLNPNLPEYDCHKAAPLS